MVRINKVYTKTGDDGSTGLVGGRRVKKNHLRIECYGTVDELNAVIGISVEQIKLLKKLSLDIYVDQLKNIQNRLFDIGSELATAPEDEYEGMIKVGKDEVTLIENLIDGTNEELSNLKSFVLPGGNLACAYLHLARTVTRRTERLLISLSDEEKVRDEILTYFNRLSDFFFVLSRFVIKEAGDEELLWSPGKS